MSHFAPNHAPVPPHERDDLHRSHTEAIYITTMTWAPRRRSNGDTMPGGEYLTHWYLGEIPEDAVSAFLPARTRTNHRLHPDSSGWYWDAG
jgi:hypothetical protein